MSADASQTKKTFNQRVLLYQFEAIKNTNIISVLVETLAMTHHCKGRFKNALRVLKMSAKLNKPEHFEPEFSIYSFDNNVFNFILNCL